MVMHKSLNGLVANQGADLEELLWSEGLSLVRYRYPKPLIIFLTVGLMALVITNLEDSEDSDFVLQSAARLLNLVALAMVIYLVLNVNSPKKQHVS